MNWSLECKLEHHIIKFSRYLREQGLNVGVRETLDTLRAVKFVSEPTEENLKVVTRTLFCCSKDEVEQFDNLFTSFWKGDSRRFRSRMKVSQRFEQQQSPSSVIWMGMNSGDKETEHHSREVSGANAAEKLQRTDFSKISEVDAEELEKLARRLWQEMNKRWSRRWKMHHRKGKVNIRRTVRRNISSGGDPIRLSLIYRKPRKPRMVVFLDISGSMDKYSFYLLRFIEAIQSNFQQVETFLFSTRLYRITDILKHQKSTDKLRDLTERAQGWSSGTTMGHCFEEFNKKFAAYSLSRQSIVLILSDGLDTGETSDLKQELTKIARRSRKLIWLNPLMGMEGYQPTARGMLVALPFIDVFSSAHNLQSLLELEKYLQNVQ